MLRNPVGEPHETWRSGGPSFLAVMYAQIYGDSERRCIWLGGASGGGQMIWPAYYRMRFNPVRVEDPFGNVVARGGDWIVTVGGGVPFAPRNPRCPGAFDWVWLPGSIEFWGRVRPAEYPWLPDD